MLFDEPFWLVHPQKHPLNEKKKISQADLDSTDLLLLAEGHCLAEQAMEVCRIQERGMQGDLADLRAASLETLLQMVAAGFGCTLLPALALSSASARDSNIKARQLKLPDTYRRISLVFRRTFPRRKALEVFAELALENLRKLLSRAEMITLNDPYLLVAVTKLELLCLSPPHIFHGYCYQ